jgi:Arc/MetJ family transcription regulator
MANVKRTSMFLDRDLVEEAAAELGTKGPTETVHAAMREIVRVARAREGWRQIREMISRGELVDPEYAENYGRIHGAE